MKSLPTLPKSKAKEVQCIMEAVFKAVNYRNSMMNHEVGSNNDTPAFTIVILYSKSIYEKNKSWQITLIHV